MPQLNLPFPCDIPSLFPSPSLSSLSESKSCLQIGRAGRRSPGPRECLRRFLLSLILGLSPFRPLALAREYSHRCPKTPRQFVSRPPKPPPMLLPLVPPESWWRHFAGTLQEGTVHFIFAFAGPRTCSRRCNVSPHLALFFCRRRPTPLSFRRRHGQSLRLVLAALPWPRKPAWTAMYQPGTCGKFPTSACTSS